MKVGQVLGHYHVVRTLGRGGMGAVYEANDTRLNRQVALKVLPSAKANDPEWFRRFEREAQAVAALNHPNIVTIHSVEEADDVHFIILELVGGKTLDEVIPEGGLPIDRFFDIAIPLTDAIATAHRRGIAHRDLKPANVMVNDDGRVKVLDFGIAKLIEEEVSEDEAATSIGAEAITSGASAAVTSGASEALTEEGKIVGTVAYMSPEQAEGKPADHRTDIFSLGILLYEMATGDRPFAGDTKLSILASIVKDEPPPIYERNMQMPRHLARIIKKALEKKLDRRYQSMVELHNDLIELKEEIDAGVPLITGEALTDPGAMDAYRAPAITTAGNTGLWLGVAGVAVAIAVLAWAFFGGGFGDQPEGPPAFTVRQLTSTEGVDFGGSISDTGDWFAYTRRENGVYRILLQSVGSRTAIPLVDNGGASPAFDPGGERIAFSGSPVLSAGVYLGGGIFVMNRMGEDRRMITERGFNPAWSPDGERIVYAGEFVWFDPYTRQEDSKLYIVAAEGGSPQELNISDGVQPSWSPNGHRIAYWGMEDGQRDIWTVPARTDITNNDRIAVTDDAYVDYSPTWSPDGRWLYFASTRGGSMAIWRVRIDEQSGETIGEAQQITSGGIADDGMLSFSADGSRLLYTSVLTQSRIVAADFDPERLRVSDELEAVVQGTRRLADPHVSADGTTLTYRTAGAQQDILVADVDTGDERQLTNDLFKDWWPRWSPNGDKIAFYTNDGGDYEIWVMNPDGTGRMQLTDTREGLAPQRPTWSPDGLRLATYITEGGADEARAILIDATVGAEEQEEQRLPPAPAGRGVFQTTDWSPDGRSLVGTVAPEAGTSEPPTIWRLDLETNEYAFLVDGTAPVWMADGRRVLYRTDDPAGFAVVDSVSLAVVHIDTPTAEAMVLSPDNRRAYFLVVQEEADLWLLELGER